MKTFLQLLPFSVIAVIVAINITLVGCGPKGSSDGKVTEQADAKIVISDEPYVPPAKEDQVKISGQIANIDGRFLTVDATSSNKRRTVEVADSATVWRDGDRVGMELLKVADVIDLFCESKQEAIDSGDASDDQLQAVRINISSVGK